MLFCQPTFNCKENCSSSAVKKNLTNTSQKNLSKAKRMRRKDSTALMYLNNTVLCTTVFTYSIKMLLEKNKECVLVQRTEWNVL